MVVSFATSDASMASVVNYGTQPDRLSFAAYGTKTSYSATLFFPTIGGWDQLTNPNMGDPQPGATLPEMLALQDTRSWAKRQWAHDEV